MRARFATATLPFMLALVCSLPVSAQQYTGTFTVANDVGGVMTLVLREAGDRVTGTLSSNGSAYQIDGYLEEGMATGSMRGPEGILYFEAERYDGEIWVMLYGSHANGEPNYDDYSEVTFIEQGAGTPGAARGQSSGAGGGNPLSDQTGGNPLADGTGDPYVGTFSDGNVTLRLQGRAGRYEGQVMVGNEVYSVQAQGSDYGIQGVINAPDGQYELSAQPQAGGLFVVSGGMQYRLIRRRGAAEQMGGFGLGRPQSLSGADPGQGQPGAQTGGARTSTGRELAPGFSESGPEVQRWIQFLAGNKLTRMSSYSSGNAGGYSSRTDVYLCSDRSFAMRGENSVSVDVGGASGSSSGADGGQGQWYVITNGQAIGLILEYASGEIQEFRMEYQNQETYANGERVYLTPAEVCR